MAQPVNLTAQEFNLMQQYIEDECGIHISEEKTYLIETRLTTLMVESGCSNFTQFYQKARADTSGSLRDKIVDAMSTNETLWFRDSSPFVILREVLLPEYAKEIAQGRRQKIRIWSAACSSGQEPYSVAITALEYMQANPALKRHHLEITGTDISQAALFLAKAGRYDSIAMSRGMPNHIAGRYFSREGRVSVISDNVKNMVTFKKHSLLDDFSGIGSRDIILCRNVLIYFNDEMKKRILGKIASLLRPSGHLFLGASESLINYSREYEMKQHGKGMYYKVKR